MHGSVQEHNRMTYLHTHKKQGIRQKGFTLLLAALVASVVLAMGAAIYSIAVKSLNLSAVGRDSQFAFYAADTAAECALYWDINKNVFSTSSPPSSVSCDNASTTVSTATELPPPGAWSATTFVFQTEPNGVCAIVSVSKRLVLGVMHNLIHSDGFNVPCVATSTSPRALQRSVELNY